MENSTNQLAFSFHRGIDYSTCVSIIERRSAFSIAFFGNSVVAECVLETDRFVFYSGCKEPREFGLFDIAGVSQTVASLPSTEDLCRDMRFRMHLQRQIRGQFRRLHLQIPAAIRCVNASVQRSTVGAKLVPNHPEIRQVYDSQDLVQDICTYTAAAFALGWLPELARALSAQQSSYGTARYICSHRVFMTLPVLETSTDGSYNVDHEGRPDFLESFKDWSRLYSASGRKGPNLMETLASCTICDPELLLLLPSISLPRHITDQVELAFLLQALRTEYAFSGAPDLVRIAARTTRPELERTMKRLSRSLGISCKVTRPSSIEWLADLCASYPGVHNGRLSGLVTKALAWKEHHLEEWICEHGGRDAANANPPIQLPVAPGIRFLSTLGAVALEGIEQGLCLNEVECLTESLQGNRYFFSIRRSEYRATASVGRDGALGRIVGFCNCTTESPATRYARRILTTWSQELKFHLTKNGF